MSRRPPNRFDRESVHAYYGIFSWFSQYTDIKDACVQKGLVDWFLQDYGFVDPEAVGKKKVKAARAMFISNRWETFKKYVLCNYKLYPEDVRIANKTTH